STTTGKVTDPSTGNLVQWQGQMVWRYHPISKAFEIYAEGGGNTFSLEIDSYGRVFSGTNNGKTRGMYYPQGSYGKKNWGKHGPLTNPYAFGYFQHMAHEGDQRRFTQTFCIYENNRFPPEWQGKIIAGNSLHNQILVSQLHRDGSTFRTVDEEPLITTNDRWFRPVFTDVGPDGYVYIADWYDTRLSHVRPVDDWHKSSGRIYRVVPDPDERAPAPQPILNSSAAAEGLESESPHVRRLTVRTIGDEKQVSETVGSKLIALAEKEPNVDVRSQLAATAKRLPPDTAIPLLRQLLGHDSDLSDPHLPLMIWWAFEAHADAPQVAALSIDPLMWERPMFAQFVAERLARRWAMAGELRHWGNLEHFLSATPPHHHQTIIKGIQLAFQGGLPDELPPSFRSILDQSLTKTGNDALVDAVRLQVNDPSIIERARNALANREEDEVTRIQLAQAFGRHQDTFLIPILLRILAEDQRNALKRVALQELARFPDPNIADGILRRYGSTLPAEHDVRSTAHRVLASRPSWAQQLLSKLESATVKARDLEPDVVEVLRQYRDPRIQAAVRSHWPATVDPDHDTLRTRIRTVFAKTDEQGDLAKGRTTYRSLCGTCHRLFEEGGTIGPDLTGYERSNLNFWLDGTLTPSAELREGYVNYLATMHDGQFRMGFLEDSDPKTVTLRDLAGQRVVLARDQIQSLEAQATSIMPRGLLDSLSDGELRDLFAWLTHEAFEPQQE
ncbi:MAG: dehydrogenase, partial [Verrucomicrobiota bacterium]